MLKRLLSMRLLGLRARDPIQPDITPLLRDALEAQQAGDARKAEALLRNCIALDPEAASPHALLAHLLGSKGRDAEAREVYARAVSLGSNSPEFLYAYALLLTRLHDRAAAEDVYHDIMACRPDWDIPYVRCGWLAFERSDWNEAVDLFRRALVRESQSSEAHLGLAMALLNTREIPKAIVHARSVLEAEPGNLAALDLLAAARRRMGEAEGLKEILRERLRWQNSDGIHIALALSLPSILDSREEAASVRNDLSDAVEHLLAKKLSVADPLAEIGATTFYLAYHGENDRHLQERVAALHLHACPELAFVADHRGRSHRKAHDRIRLGIVSSCLHEHSIARVLHGLVTRLDRRRFSVHLYPCRRVDDARSRALERDADEWTLVPRNLADARALLARSELDVILYPDIGMDAFTYFLAFSRLAPVQCTTWGHPVTTGIRAIDYFVSTDYFECEGSEGQYSERLVKLQDVAFPGYYERPNLPPSSSQSVGFDRGRRVYFCPQRLFKHHPDFDALVAGILRRDPQGEVVLTYVPDEDIWRLPRLQARLARTCSDVYDRIIFLPTTPSYSGYIQRLRECDVVLDTIHYCGGNTSLEAISAGALVVTLPLALNRGRHTYGFLQKMRFTDTVATSADDYVDRAVRIATSPELRMELKKKQAESCAALYEDDGAIRQMERFFEDALASSAAQPPL